MTPKDIMEFLHAYGIKGTIVGLIVMVAYGLFKTSWFSGLMTKISDRIIDMYMKKKTGDGNIKSIAESDILNHDIFNYIDFWTYSKVPTMQFSTEYRTVVFRKYLTILLKKHTENIRKYISGRTFAKMDDSELWTSFLSLINDIIFDYEREMESAGIPKVVIEKMKVKNNDTISLTIDLIEGVCNSQFYSSENNFLKVYSILNIMLSILENTISNSEHICDGINGQLKGMSMDGKTEP